MAGGKARFVERFSSANFVVDRTAYGEEGVAKRKESIYDFAFMDVDIR
jgi:hypothetical protein